MNRDNFNWIEILAQKTVLSLLLGIWLLGVVTTAAAQSYRFGVFPHFSPLKLAQAYQPMMDALSERLQRPVFLKTATTFEQFFSNVQQQQYDFALLQPFFYASAVERHHYLPLAKLSAPLQAIVIVLASSDLQQLSDLAGFSVATPSAMAAVSRLFDRRLRAQQLAQAIHIVDAKNHDRCYQLLMTHKVRGCVTAKRALVKADRRLQEKFKIIDASESIPHIVVVAHQRVPAYDRRRVLKFLISSPLVEEIFGGDVAPAYDPDYDVVREMAK